MTEAEIVRWHHLLNGHEFQQAPGDSEGQGSLACCSSWGRTESDTTEATLQQQQQQQQQQRALDTRVVGVHKAEAQNWSRVTSTTF